MAKNGFRLIDAEMHVMEPTDLWQRYIDPEFKARAPRRLSDRKWDIRTLVEGEVMAQIPGGDWPAETGAEEKALAERYAEEIARNFDPESQVKAMDKEGLDLAILFPTSAMYVTAFTRMGCAVRRRGLPRLQQLALRLHPGGRPETDVRRRCDFAARGRQRRRRDPPRGRRTRHEGDLPAAQHLQ
jgi:hypothetical protein